MCDRQRSVTGSCSVLIVSFFLCVLSASAAGQVDKGSTTASSPIIKAAAMQRPRLYIDKQKLSFIKANLNREPYRYFLDELIRKVDGYKSRPLPLTDVGQSDGSIREYGIRLPNMAMAWLLTDQAEYREMVTATMDRLVAYDNWASNQDIGAAHLLFGMSVAYDWLYPDLTAVERKYYRERVILQANILYDAYRYKQLWWATTWMQNHNYTNTMSFAIAGVALLGEYDAAADWIAAAESNFSTVMDYLSPDGASHEGVGYWGYGMESLLKYYLGTERIYGLKGLLDSNYFRGALNYRLHMSLPGFRQNANYADSPLYDWHGPGFILRAHAQFYQDGLGNWLASKIESVRGRGGSTWLEHPKSSWLDLILFDETVTLQQGVTVQPYAYFNNLGILVARDSWDTGNFWTIFKAGPSQGARALRKNHFAGSHIHPDSGHYSIWWKDKWMAMDDGQTRTQLTRNHNVLTFRGQGQLGGGSNMFRKAQLKHHLAASNIIHSDITGDYQYLVAEISRMYPPEAGVSSWQRSYVSFPNGDVIVHDHVEMKDPGKVESLVHVADTARAGNMGAVCIDGDSGYALYPFLPDGWDLTHRQSPIPMKERAVAVGNFDRVLVTEEGNVGSAVELTNIFSARGPGCASGKEVFAVVNSDVVLLAMEDGSHYRMEFGNRKISKLSNN